VYLIFKSHISSQLGKNSSQFQEKRVVGEVFGGVLHASAGQEEFFSLLRALGFHICRSYRLYFMKGNNSTVVVS
jgi:hypothetical protein